MARITDKLAWYYGRWRAMDHPREDFYRLRQFITNHVVDRLAAGRLPKMPQGFVYADKTGIRYSIESLAELQPADRPINRFPLLDTAIEDVQTVTDWRKDHKSGRSSGVAFCHAIDPQDFEAVGDVKYVVVLSRFHFLPFYAINAVAHGSDSATGTIARIVASWTEQNPYLYSVNWFTGIEVAIRALNLVYARKILTLTCANEKLLASIDALVYASLHYLVRHKSLFSSANNHLVAELLGIIVILSHYEHPARSRIWRGTARLFVDELLRQNYGDGGNKEQATQYHVEVLDAGVMGLHLLRAAGYDLQLGREVENRLTEMGVFLRYCMAPGDQILRFGDDDEGHFLFPYYDVGFAQARSVLSSLELYQSAGVTDERAQEDIRVYLIGGEAWRARFAKEKEKENARGNGDTLISSGLGERLFAESGYAFFRSDESTLVMDVGEIGLRPLAAHGHSDLLSFVLSYKGIPFLVDPGTFQYHGRTPYRRYFRSVWAHNTVAIDGLDQARAGGRMIWLNHPKVLDLQFDSDGERIRCEAAHDGFVRQGRKVFHRRCIEYWKKEKQYVITDRIIGTQRHVVDVFLHFHPAVEVVRIDSRVFLARSKGRTLRLENDLFGESELFYGSEEPISGWYSPRYGKKEPAYTLRCRCAVAGDGLLETRIQLADVE